MACRFFFFLLAVGFLSAVNAQSGNAGLSGGSATATSTATGPNAVSTVTFTASNSNGAVAVFNNGIVTKGAGSSQLALIASLSTTCCKAQIQVVRNDTNAVVYYSTFTSASAVSINPVFSDPNNSGQYTLYQVLVIAPGVSGCSATASGVYFGLVEGAATPASSGSLTSGSASVTGVNVQQTLLFGASAKSGSITVQTGAGGKADQLTVGANGLAFFAFNGTLTSTCGIPNFGQLAVSQSGTLINFAECFGGLNCPATFANQFAVYLQAGQTLQVIVRATGSDSCTSTASSTALAVSEFISL